MAQANRTLWFSQLVGWIPGCSLGWIPGWSLGWIPGWSLGWIPGWFSNSEVLFYSVFKTEILGLYQNF